MMYYSSALPPCQIKLLIQRRNWKSATNDIANLTEHQLRDALKALECHHKIDDPLIRRLLYSIQTIAVRVPAA